MREQPGSCRMRVIRAGAQAQIRRAWCGPANWLTRSPACGSHKAAKAGRRDFTLPSLAFRSGAGLTGPKLIQLPPSHRLSRQGEAPLWSPVGAWADIRCDPPLLPPVALLSPHDPTFTISSCCPEESLHELCLLITPIRMSPNPGRYRLSPQVSLLRRSQWD